MLTTLPARPDLEKLPQKYRHYVQALESALREHADARDAQAPTRIIVEPYGAKRYLPDDVTVRYLFERDGRTEHLDLLLRDIHSMSVDDRSALSIRGSRLISLAPSSGNEVYLQPWALGGDW